MRLLSLRFPLLAATVLSSGPIFAEESEGVRFFEKEIRPILAENCYECHSDKKHKAGLRLDNLPYILQGGESGPGLVPHQPAKSLLIKAVSYEDEHLEMPPSGKLSDQQVAALKQWIAMGAPWPQAEVAKAEVLHKPGKITDEDRAWWAFQPVKAVTLKQAGVANDAFANAGKGIESAQNPIDSWIRHRLAKDGLEPAPQASPTELIRRVYFDLIGLPPPPEAVAAFVQACAEESKTSSAASARSVAYERLIDELLASPRYGERQAQHWLDLTRYAESEGYRLDAYRPNVWPYRDYVIRSFNDDKPYSQFVREQIAGDEIAPEDPNVVIGTAFLRHTIYEYNQRDAEGQWKGIVNEVTDVTGDVFMGMSMQCAQCHDHKFDPILQKDYYRLQAFFNNITWPDDKPLATSEQKAAYEKQLALWKEATVAPRKVIDDILEPRIIKAQTHAMSLFPDEVQAMYNKPREQRTAYEEQIVQLAWKQAEYERVRYKEDKLKPEDKAQLASAREQLAAFDHLKPQPLPTAFIIGETGHEAMPAQFKTRKGAVPAAPGFLTILDAGDAFIPAPPKDGATSGRRTVLADWLTRPDNPLTTRVIVNRLWQHHFGRGLVATTSDFGRLGDKPSHPELLDWLTSEFVKGGWHMKPLHKMILMSATYRQSAHIKPSQTALLKDPDNRLLWRFSPRRLDAEQARDAVLTATGELKVDMGGEGAPPAQPRRSIYTKKIRNTQDEFLRSLDAPAGFQSIAERQSTTTATQSLLLVNGDWPLDRSRAMALRLSKSYGLNDPLLVTQAFLNAYSRQPNPEEQQAATTFLQKQRAQLRQEIPPPPPLASPLAKADSFFGSANASKTTKALLLKPGSPNEKLRVQLAADRMETEAFAVEAVVSLNSIYPDASVRTIASRWNNSKTEAGWCLGVTSQKSAYKPNNLIVQLSGDDFQGTPMYEVVASNIFIQVGRPYYVAASLDNHPGEGQAFGGTITFYVKDLSDPKAPMQTVKVNHQVCGGYINKQRALYVGGREVDKRSVWDGAIARVALRRGQLDGGRLMAWVGASDSTCLVDVNADELSKMQNAAPTQRWTLETSQPPTKGSGSVRLDANREALADLCHMLLNSNEFFYLH